MTEIIAHRGLRSEFPENTLSAIESALTVEGLHGVEFDVELTKDGKGVVLHQETVSPDVAFKKIELASRNYSSRDWVGECLAPEVMSLDAGSWFDKKFSNERVPSLESVLALNWSGKAAYVELKDATYWGKRDSLLPSRIVEAVLPSLRNFPGQLRVISFNALILAELAKRAPEIVTVLALWTERESQRNESLAEAKQCGASVVSLPDTMILSSPEWVSYAHRRNLKIHAYPVSPARDEPEFLNWTAQSQTERWHQLRGLGIDAIITDFARDTVKFMV